MSFASSFTISLGIFMVLMAAVSSWLFRSAPVHTLVKISYFVLLTCLACWVPFQLSSLLGYPVQTEVDSLPMRAEFIALVPHDDDHKVDLWLREDGRGSPRAFTITLTDALKKTLRQAQREQAQDGRAMLVKAGKEKRPYGYIDIDGGKAPYELDLNAFSLPNKGPEQ